ncbi:MAG: hypothetical protein EZS28_012093 [Streblomastix strix]|uniref:Uncharacterized protein n=1 Tax=Streblomastix strix TaxID=222440 RepID=A0A5J4WBV9_9EUKA|nr:MAG: hypothetical protein EZS28_012093 [Streblomastix strix]
MVQFTLQVQSIEKVETPLAPSGVRVYFTTDDFLGGVKKAAQWVAPALHKVLSIISGTVGMIHPRIGGALRAETILAETRWIKWYNDVK